MYPHLINSSTNMIDMTGYQVEILTHIIAKGDIRFKCKDRFNETFHFTAESLVCNEHDVVANCLVFKYDLEKSKNISNALFLWTSALEMK